MKKKIEKTEFLNNHVYGLNIYADNKYVYLDELQIYPYFNNYFLKYIGLIIGIIFSITVLILNNKRVRKIEFNANYPINVLIEKQIYENTNNFLSWRFLKKSIIEINHEIKGRFPMYEWIGIHKDNNTIYVNITNNKTKEHEIINIDKNLIAKKDGLVKQYVIYEGTGKIRYNMNVKKGDILISNEIERTRGYVLAETFDEINIKISKENIKTQLTGNIKKYKVFNLFGLDLKFNYKNDFEYYEEKQNKIFGIDKLFSYSDIYIYEKSDIIDMYSIEDAKKLIYTYIDENFEKTLDNEKIIEIIYLSEEETKTDLIFKVLVKKIENIGVYEWF